MSDVAAQLASGVLCFEAQMQNSAVGSCADVSLKCSRVCCAASCITKSKSNTVGKSRTSWCACHVVDKQVLDEAGLSETRLPACKNPASLILLHASIAFAYAQK